MGATPVASIFSCRRLTRVALAGAFAAVLGLHAGCNMGGNKGVVNVPLEYRPNHALLITGTLTATDVTVHVEPVVDKRTETESIGQNVEEAGQPPIPVYASGKAPGEFLDGVLEEELRTFGVVIAEAPEAADRIIALELTKFWVEESKNYRAEIRAMGTVRDKGGRVLWKGPVGGDGRTFGRSLNPANYNQVLSDASRRTVEAMLANPKFQEALAK